jgi:hypothetical protein
MISTLPLTLVDTVEVLRLGVAMLIANVRWNWSWVEQREFGCFSSDLHSSLLKKGVSSHALQLNLFGAQSFSVYFPIDLMLSSSLLPL